MRNSVLNTNDTNAIISNDTEANSNQSTVNYLRIEYAWQVSVDYLTKPLDIFKEMSRILKPGGLAVMR